MYKISEFRKNIAQAFTDSSEGHEVIITHKGQNYQLVALVDKPLPGHSMESIPGSVPKLKHATTKLHCNGHPNWRRSCGLLGCDYSS